MTADRLFARTAAGLAFALAVAGPASAQSLWPGDEAVSPIADTVARRRGDVVTILIREVQAVENEEESKQNRKTSLSAKIDAFGIKPNAFDLPMKLAEVSSEKGFEGSATYDKEGRFEARISAVVVDVQPNGNLVVEGRRRIRIDNEVKTIKVAGIVRPLDLNGSNVVLSENVANASIDYVGDGPLTRATTRGFFGRLFDAVFHVLWPF